MSKKLYVEVEPFDISTLFALAVVTVVIAAFVYAYSIASSIEYMQQNDDIIVYCEMVKLHDETDGLRGWPDYNHNAAELCGGGSNGN